MLVADVAGDVVALGHLPAVRRAHVLVAAELVLAEHRLLIPDPLPGIVPGMTVAPTAALCRAGRRRRLRRLARSRRGCPEPRSSSSARALERRPPRAGRRPAGGGRAAGAGRRGWRRRLRGRALLRLRDRRSGRPRWQPTGSPPPGTSARAGRAGTSALVAEEARDRPRSCWGCPPGVVAFTTGCQTAPSPRGGGRHAVSSALAGTSRRTAWPARPGTVVAAPDGDVVLDPLRPPPGWRIVVARNHVSDGRGRAQARRGRCSRGGRWRTRRQPGRTRPLTDRLPGGGTRVLVTLLADTALGLARVTLMAFAALKG